jgi:phosphatidate cytidylyltransferase
MKTRVLSGLIMAPLLVVVFFGGPVLFVGALAISLMAAWEYARAFEGGKPLMRGAMLVCVVMLYAGAMFPLAMFPMLLAIIMFIMFLRSFSMKEYGVEQTALSIMGVLYTGFFPLHIVLIDQLFVSGLWDAGAVFGYG